MTARPASAPDFTRRVRDLIRAVASPGGTTEAALKVLQTPKLSGIIKQTLLAAYRRAQELSGGGK